MMVKIYGSITSFIIMDKHDILYNVVKMYNQFQYSCNELDFLCSLDSKKNFIINEIFQSWYTKNDGNLQWPTNFVLFI